MASRDSFALFSLLSFPRPIVLQAYSTDFEQEKPARGLLGSVE